ncbi:MAG: LysE family transporter [Flavobacteriaceae bacterium]|nr:LysE family transporter [Flavobacteriaceae bacterium]
MQFVETFFLATLMSILGFLPPGMMNMTTVKVALEQSRKNALQFILGTLFIIAIQAYIALYFSQYLAQNPDIVKTLSYIGIFVFIALALLFFRQAKSNKIIGGIADGSLISGIKMASMNMLAIPFFLAYSTAMEASGLIQNIVPDRYFFVAGAVFGCFLLFSAYMLLAEFIQKRAVFVSRNINYILSGLFVFLAVITTYKVIFT